WRHMTFWGGMRGALSVALALSVATLPGVNPNVSVLAYGMVVISLLVQGGLLLPVAELLKLRPRAAVTPPPTSRPAQPWRRRRCAEPVRPRPATDARATRSCRNA